MTLIILAGTTLEFLLTFIAMTVYLFMLPE